MDTRKVKQVENTSRLTRFCKGVTELTGKRPAIVFEAGGRRVGRGRQPTVQGRHRSGWTKLRDTKYKPPAACLGMPGSGLTAGVSRPEAKPSVGVPQVIEPYVGAQQPGNDWGKQLQKSGETC